MAQTDTSARNRAYHEANDVAQRITGSQPKDAGPTPDEARHAEHERKNTDADDALVPVEDRKPREVPYA